MKKAYKMLCNKCNKVMQVNIKGDYEYQSILNTEIKCLRCDATFSIRNGMLRYSKANTKIALKKKKEEQERIELEQIRKFHIDMRDHLYDIQQKSDNSYYSVSPDYYRELNKQLVASYY